MVAIRGPVVGGDLHRTVSDPAMGGDDPLARRLQVRADLCHFHDRCRDGVRTSSSMEFAKHHGRVVFTQRGGLCGLCLSVEPVMDAVVPIFDRRSDVLLDDLRLSSTSRLAAADFRVHRVNVRLSVEVVVGVFPPRSS